ncbi:hypothetical protein D3C76_1709020 [compost metagenome]
MAWFILRDIASVRRLQIEGDDITTFIYFTGHNKGLEKIPAMLLFLCLFVHSCFNADESFSNYTIRFLPSLHNVISGSVPKHFLDGFQQIFSNDGIMLRLDS